MSLMQSFARVTIQVLFWIAVVLGVGGLVAGIVAVIELNFVGLLTAWVVSGFWFLMAYVSRYMVSVLRHDETTG